MSKKKRKKNKSKNQHNKGTINDNALKALVKSDMFLQKKHRDKTKYKRKDKHKKSQHKAGSFCVCLQKALDCANDIRHTFITIKEGETL